MTTKKRTIFRSEIEGLDLEDGVGGLIEVFGIGFRKRHQ